MSRLLISHRAHAYIYRPYERTPNDYYILLLLLPLLVSVVFRVFFLFFSRGERSRRFDLCFFSSYFMMND